MSKKFFSVVAILLIAAGQLPLLYSFWIPLTLSGDPALAPAADTYVDSSQPGVNFGARTTLRVDGSPLVRTYLRFDLSQVSGTIMQARLRVYANSASGSGISVAPVKDSAWSETGATYSNAPAVGDVFATSGPVSAGSWVELDVTALAQDQGQLSLALGTPGVTAISLASRESGAHAPLLAVLTTPTATAPTSPPTASLTPTPDLTLTPTATLTPPPALTSTATPPAQTQTPTPTSVGGVITLAPAADSYVDSANPTANFGGKPALRVDGSPVVRSYLRFDLRPVGGAIIQARLRIYANSASTSGISVAPVSSSSWTETGITFANAPAAGNVFATTGAVSAGRWQELDVTGLAQGGGLLSLALGTPGATAISLASREAGANAPQLVIYTVVAPTATPTGPTTTFTPWPSPTPTNTGDNPILLAAGDITKCLGGTPAPNSGAQITSDMLLNAAGNIFTLGDNSNDAGSASDYANCFDPTWGRLKARLNPSLGNHDVITDPQGGPYFNYFGAASHPDSFGHYSLDLGSWHIIVLNAECGVGGQGCEPGSTQEQWLRADLAAHTQQCTLAIWHQPLFTSGTQAPTTGMRAFWQALYDYHAEIVLDGHNHNYERFAPQDPAGNPDPTNGMREFVVGTGGASLDPSNLPLAPNEEVRSAKAYGYLQLTLKPGSYDWKFVAQPGSTFSDSGSGVCH